MSVSQSANGYVVTYLKQGHTLKSILYGEVTPERIAAAKAELAHRADQLFTVETAAPATAYRPRRSSSESYHNPEWEDDTDDDFDDEDDLD
jgi:hypothetical protein